VSSSEERKKRSFVERQGLWNDEQFEAAANADKSIEERGLEVVRLSFPDQHGVLRGKTEVETDGSTFHGIGRSMFTATSELRQTFGANCDAVTVDPAVDKGHTLAI
jgi:RNA-splicing ligase RtcB